MQKLEKDLFTKVVRFDKNWLRNLEQLYGGKWLRIAFLLPLFFPKKIDQFLPQNPNLPFQEFFFADWAASSSCSYNHGPIIDLNPTPSFDHFRSLGHVAGPPASVSYPSPSKWALNNALFSLTEVNDSFQPWKFPTLTNGNDQSNAEVYGLFRQSLVRFWSCDLGETDLLASSQLGWTNMEAFSFIHTMCTCTTRLLHLYAISAGIRLWEWHLLP